jgi:predicted MFS family arabinose efflux permease
MNTSFASNGAQHCASPWSAVAAVGVGAFAIVTSEFLPVGLLPQIARDLRITEGQSGLMVTLPAIVAVVAALTTSTLFARIDRRHLMMGLLAVLGVSNMLVALATNVDVLLAVRALIGAAVGAFWSVGCSMGPRLRPGREGIRAAAIIQSGVSIGTIAGVPAGALFGHLMGWRWAFGAASIMALLVFCAFVLWLPSIKPDAAKDATSTLQPLKNRRLRIALLITLALFTFQFGTYTYIAPFLVQISHINAQHVSGVLLGYGVAGFLGNLIGGWACSKQVRLSVITTGIVIGTALICLAVFGRHPIIATACVLWWGFGFGLLPISVQSHVFEVSPNQMDLTGSMFVAMAQISIAVGSLAGGLIVDHVGLITLIAVGGVLSLATALAIFYFMAGALRTKRTSAQPSLS